ncbi:hypothetical protein FOA52_009619 [Chlamydomonas sp. UWO 241]|nr:hypothetical protein FOA52_009619 [Chlamydomonas sp. UWO 241]
MAGTKKATPPPRWLAANPGKRWTEVFFLVYSPLWMTWALCVMVPLELYEWCQEWGYLLIGTAAALPIVVLPLFLQSKADAAKPWHQRYWVKANVWIAIFGFVGNYLWTHYFYKMLGAAYTIQAHRLNDVPIVMYLMTHAYFTFYHALSNVLLRRVRTGMAGSSKAARVAAMGVLIFVLSYSTAYMETLTISHYPYYTFIDKAKMYTVGSLFYAIYFFVSFPMFFRIDEDPKVRTWSLWDCATDSLAASMLVTILLDFWRLAIGDILGGGSGGLPWMA